MIDKVCLVIIEIDFNIYGLINMNVCIDIKYREYGFVDNYIFNNSFGGR